MVLSSVGFDKVYMFSQMFLYRLHKLACDIKRYGGGVSLEQGLGMGSSLLGERVGGWVVGNVE